MLKDKIISAYYLEHLKVKEIAENLSVSTAYVSKTIKKDSRYTEEKQYRKDNSIEKRRIEKNKYIKDKREKQKIEDNYQAIKVQHNQASRELSKARHLSNESYRKWNCSAYNYNPSKHRYEFDSELRSLLCNT